MDGAYPQPLLGLEEQTNKSDASVEPESHLAGQPVVDGSVGQPAESAELVAALALLRELDAPTAVTPERLEPSQED